MRILAPLFLFFVVSCAGVVPETGTERYVVADGMYTALLLTVQEGVVRGTIKGDTAVKLKVALTTTKIALDAWALIPESPTAETAALVALQSIRNVLRVAP